MASCALFDGDYYADDELVTRGVTLEPCLGRQTTARSEPLKGLLQPPLSSLGRFPSADSWFASLDAPLFALARSSPTVLRGRDQEPRQLLARVVAGLSDAYPVAVLKPMRPKHAAWAVKLELLCGFEPLVVKLRAEGRDLELRRSRGDGFQFAAVLRACRRLVQGSTAAACRLPPPPPEPDVQALVAFAQAWPDEGVAALGRQLLALPDAALARELAPHLPLLAAWLASPEQRVALAACALCARLEAPELAEKAAARAAAAGLVGLAKAH